VSGTVTLLYTANLAGDLALLPRLFTLIRQERRAANSPVFLLDLGDTCSVDSWICRATQGRAPLIVLDGMGYDAALIGGPEQIPIPPASLQYLLETLVMPVIEWNSAAYITKRGVTLAVASGTALLPTDHPGIWIDRLVQALPENNSPSLILGDVAKGCLARVDLAWPAWTIQASRLLQLPPDLPPDPTIAAAVDFVTNEARSYAQQHGGNL
jgi:hypothetical protein